MRRSDYPDLNKVLSQWFQTVCTSNVPPSGPLLQEKARYFTEQLGYENFKANNGVLDRFKEREGIMGQSVCGEEKSVDQDIVHAWCERLPDICPSTVQEMDIMQMRPDFFGRHHQCKP